MSNSDTWECRLCEGSGMTGPEMTGHLVTEHGLEPEAVRELTGRLHAAKDYPEFSENTLGFYRGEALICLCVQRREREPDDPMRF